MEVAIRPQAVKCDWTWNHTRWKELNDMSLGPNEIEIVDLWRMVDGRPVEDEVSRRIRTITKHWLKGIASSGDGWECLYEDTEDHRLWELTYPSSESQGGVLRVCVS